MFEDIDPGHLSVIRAFPFTIFDTHCPRANHDQVANLDIRIRPSRARGMLPIRDNLDRWYFADLNRHPIAVHVARHPGIANRAPQREPCLYLPVVVLHPLGAIATTTPSMRSNRP